MGHYAYYCCTKGAEQATVPVRAAETAAFSAIWETHPDNLATETEYFAEIFSAYFLMPGQLKEACPASYALISSAAGETA